MPGRIRANCIPSPDYSPPGRYISHSGGDSIPISILFHRFAAGRIGGRTLSGGRLLWSSAPIIRAQIEEPDSPWVEMHRCPFPAIDLHRPNGRHSGNSPPSPPFGEPGEFPRRASGSSTRLLILPRILGHGVATDVFLVSPGLSLQMGILSTLIGRFRAVG